jgi:hypothetical protein
MGGNISNQRDIIIQATSKFNVGDYVYPKGLPDRYKNENNLWIVESKPTPINIIIKSYNNSASKRNVNGTVLILTTAPKKPQIYVNPVPVTPAKIPKPIPPPVPPPAYPDLSTTPTSTSYDEIPIYEDLVEGYTTVAPTDQEKTLTAQQYESERALINEIVEFNKLYTRYIHCNPPINTERNTDYDEILGNCSTRTSLDDVNAAASRINTNIANLNIAAATTTRTNHSILMNDNAGNLQLRQELDAKLKELYNTEDSIANEYKKHYDSTIYAEILLTTLATCTLYYVFVNM